MKHLEALLMRHQQYVTHEQVLTNVRFSSVPVWESTYFVWMLKSKEENYQINYHYQYCQCWRLKKSIEFSDWIHVQFSRVQLKSPDIRKNQGLERFLSHKIALIMHCDKSCMPRYKKHTEYQAISGFGFFRGCDVSKIVSPKAQFDKETNLCVPIVLLPCIDAKFRFDTFFEWF